jgi:hypothetical protein
MNFGTCFKKQLERLFLAVRDTEFFDYVIDTFHALRYEEKSSELLNLSHLLNYIIFFNCHQKTFLLLVNFLTSFEPKSKTS